jgi:hypothetical protein
MPKKCPLKCVRVDSGVDIRVGYNQLRHRVPYTMLFFGSGLKMAVTVFLELLDLVGEAETTAKSVCLLQYISLLTANTN